MINERKLQKALDALLKAVQEYKPIAQVSKIWSKMEIEDAHAVRQLWAERPGQARIVGHKIGLTSRAMQMASKMTEQDDDGHHGSPRNRHRLAGSIGVSFS